MQTIALPSYRRRFLEIDQPDTQGDLLTLSFSSEAPVQRSYGAEVLVHQPESVDLSRINSGAAPLLWNHNPDVVLGVVESAEIADGRGTAVIRWGTSAQAQELRADVEAGVIRNVSVGYSIEHSDYDGEGTVMVTSWTPLELSLVSVPADHSVGVGRAYDTNTSTNSNTNRSQSMQRTAAQPIASGGGRIDEFQQAEHQFSVVRAMQAAASGNWTGAGLEREVSQELSLREGRSSQGILVPAAGWARRAYTAGSATEGGNLVPSVLMAGNFVEALRARLAVAELGATFMPGLQGSISIPRRTGSSTAYWFGADDADAITESTGTIGDITMSPKTVGAYTRFSRLMQLQATPDVESLIRSDFVALLAEAIDAAAINGLGSSSQPQGILQTAGIGSVAGGADGATPHLDHLINLKREVAVDNADVATCGFISTPAVEATLAQLKDGQNNYLLSPYGAELGRSQISGRRFIASTNVPSNLTKGSGTNLHAIIYGNFADLLIGMFGSLEILVDPYTDFAKGSVGVRALQSMDVAVRHPESFAAMVDADPYA